MAPKPLRFSDLSPTRQQLLRTCQRVNFGYLDNLLVQNQEPVFIDPPPLILVDIKLDADPAPTMPRGSADFELCSEFCRLMSLLDGIVNGRISRIEVRSGVPRKVLCEQPVTEAATAGQITEPFLSAARQAGSKDPVRCQMVDTDRKTAV